MQEMKKMVSSKGRPSLMRGSSSAVDLRTKESGGKRMSKRPTVGAASKSGLVGFENSSPSQSKSPGSKDLSLAGPTLSKSASAPAIEMQRRQSTGVGEATRLARKFYLDLYEVQDIMKLFRDADTNGSGGLDKEEFRHVMAHVLQLPGPELVTTDVLDSAWKDLTAKDRPAGGVVDADGMCAWEASLDSFFEWYQANMFSQVCSNSMTDAEKNTYKIAKDNDVTITVIDKLKKKFDFFDVDKSGEIDEEEFLAMLCLLLGVKDPADLAEDRVKRFWKEIDLDCSGAVTFDEFCKWFLKYFNPDDELEGDNSGLIGQFYKSYTKKE